MLKRKMSDDEDRHIEATRSKKGESRNWTQKEPARKMFNDEAYRSERKEKGLGVGRRKGKCLTMRLDS